MKGIVIAVVVLTVYIPAAAQRYLPGMRGVEAMGGVVGSADGYNLQVGWSKYTQSKHRWRLYADYLQKNYPSEVGSIPVAQFAASGGYYVRLLADYTNSAVLSAGVAGLLGYESVNWNQQRLPNGATILCKDAVIYGMDAGIELEYYVDDRYVLLAGFRQRTCRGSEVRLYHSIVSIGIKYILE